MTMQQAFENFIRAKRLADLSPKSISDYKQFVAPLVAYLGENADIMEVTLENVNGYLETLHMRPISKSTRSTYIRNVKIFLSWCEREYNVCYSTKTIKVPKSPKKNVTIYTDKQVKLILSSIQTESEWMTYRDMCIIALMYDSGLRQSEVCTLKRTKVSFPDNRLVVYGKGDKERTVPMGTLTIKLMRKYLSLCPHKSSYVFVNRLGNVLTNNAVKLLVSKLAKKLPFELSSHKLRHNFATNWCLDQYDRHGHIDIYRLMYLMGHEDIETTKRYLHFAYEIIASKESISHLDKIIDGVL